MDAENEVVKAEQAKPRAKRKTGRKAGVGRRLLEARKRGYSKALSSIAVRIPQEDIDTINKILDNQYERAAKDGKPKGIVMSEELRGIFALGLHERKIRQAVVWVTAARPVFSLDEVADRVDLPIEVLVRELAARGVVPRSDLLARIGATRPESAPQGPRQATPADAKALDSFLH